MASPRVADVLQHLEGLKETQLLENSALIYAVNNTREKDLLDILRYDSSVTLEQLQNELTKVQKLQESVRGVTESAELNQLNYYQTVIESVIRRRTNMKCITTESMINVLECQVADDNSDWKYGPDILCALSPDCVNDTLEFEERQSITPKGICKLVQLLCDPSSPFRDEETEKFIKQCLIDKLRNTLSYEMKRDEYRDLPICHAVQYSHDHMKDMYYGLDEIEQEIDTIFNEIDEILATDLEPHMYEEAIDAQFNPNPFNVYKLTPMDVGHRTLQRTIMDIAAAETDEELDEIMMEFARIENVFTHIMLEAASNKTTISKGVRKAADVSSKASSRVRTGVDKVKEFKKDTSKISEPWIKFIEDTVQKVKDKDTEERRNLIIQGGVLPKVIRWLKRGIGLVVIGHLGTAGAVIAIIGFLTFLITDVALDNKQRTLILREMEDELKIVEEKIEDSRGDEKKQAKYELMRIRNKLNTDIARIKLRLKA